MTTNSATVSQSMILIPAGGPFPLERRALPAEVDSRIVAEAHGAQA